MVWSAVFTMIGFIIGFLITCIFAFLRCIDVIDWSFYFIIFPLWSLPAFCFILFWLLIIIGATFFTGPEENA